MRQTFITIASVTENEGYLVLTDTNGSCYLSQKEENPRLAAKRFYKALEASKRDCIIPGQQVMFKPDAKEQLKKIAGE